MLDISVKHVVGHIDMSHLPLGIVRTVTTDVGRLDSYIGSLPRVDSRARAQKLISDGKVKVSGRVEKASYKVKSGDVVSIWIAPPEPTVVVPQDIPLDVLYDDNDVIVVNKARGMVVHPGAGNSSGTLVNALMYHCRRLAIQGLPLRPGIVHRIDKDTSGVLVVAKSDTAYTKLTQQLSTHAMKRVYYALVVGQPHLDEGRIETLIGRHPTQRKKMAVIPRGGKIAATNWRVLEHFRGFSLIEAKLETGRTHQIRVHMAHLGNPLVGDSVYGVGRTPAKLSRYILGQALHAAILGFVHPISGHYMEFSAEMPADMKALLDELRHM